MLERLFDAADRHPWRVAAAGALVMLGLLLACTTFDFVLREDAYFYLTNAFDIARGHWSVYYQPMGWPVVVAGALRLTGVHDLYHGMVVQRALAVLLMAATVVPFAALARRLGGPRTGTLATAAFVLSPVLIQAGVNGYSEALFLLLLVLAFEQLARTERPAFHFVLAAIPASLAWWVRPNGFIMLAVLGLVGLARLRRRELGWRPLLLMVVVFFAVSSPHMVLRTLAYGSPFSHGEISKGLADSYAEMWDRTIPVPGLWDYLATHDWHDHYQKFVHDGLLKVGWHFHWLLGDAWSLLLLLGALHQLVLERRSRANELLLAMALFLAGLVPIYQVVGTPRHITPVVPLALLVGCRLLARVLGDGRRGALLGAGAVLFFAAQVPFAVQEGRLWLAVGHSSWSVPRVEDGWALWAADHVEGTVAIIEGGDLLQMASSDPTDPSPEKAAIRPFRPGPYRDLAQALPVLERLHVGWVFVDPVNVGRRPWFAELDEPRWRERFVPVREFHAGPDEGWALPDMRVFRMLPAEDPSPAPGDPGTGG